jgi:hypothetical protein
MSAVVLMAPMVRADDAERRRCTLAPVGRLRSGVVAVLTLVSGCGVALHAGRPPDFPRDALEVTERAADRCVHGMTGPESPYRVELPGPVTDPELVLALERFPADVRRTALAAGIEPLLARIVREHDRMMVEDGSATDLLAMRDELAARMYTLETQLTAMEFEVDCVRASTRD